MPRPALQAHASAERGRALKVELILAIAGAFFLYLLWRTQLASITVFEYERGLRFVRGRLRSELGPGLYRYLRAYTVIRKVDTRPVQLPVNGQEVLSKDGVAVKVSLSAGYRVTDARAATLNADNYITALYTELQQALRAAVSATEVETLLQNRAELGPQILRTCQPAAERLGLVLERLAIRDLTLPGDLKKIFAQVVKARQEGLAALERARGETAALRNLANAAQMVQRNPQLLQLRLLQVAGQQTGTTLVIGMPQGATPIPLREGAADVEALPTEGQTDKPAE
ncbi:MAG: hypothetical protein DMD59_09030 [Gemmatimonadetes bacterium]|nr:MAG: hypothetical protein DMD59_09030 [Gemmatimonadota bacterium]